MLPDLIVITDPNLSDATLLARLRDVLSPGPRVGVQLRLPNASGRRVFEVAGALLKLCQQRGNPLFVNGRIDVALALGTHVHLPVDAPRPRELRALFSDRWISAAVHSEQEAEELNGADFALVSPVFPPGSKVGDTRPTLGLEGLRRLAATLPCPAYALGGITPENAAGLRGAARGCAVVGSVLHAEDPERAARALLGAFTPQP